MTKELRWQIAHGVTCAFSAASDGDVRDPARRQAWLERIGVPHPCAVVRQVHGVVVVDAQADRLPAADAQISTDPSLGLVAFGADCPGLCVAAPDVLGIAHCGWRGTAAGIVGQLVSAVAARSRHPVSTFVALIGPGIAAEDYEVDGPVIDSRLWPQESLRPGRPGHAWLDLPAAIAADVRRAGLSDIATAGGSTSRDPRLWSYRRHGAGQVQALVAWRQ